MPVRVEAHAEPIPGYRLIDRLGGGGFGEVWRCEAPGGMHKAIKFVYGDLSSAGDSDQRAKQELKAMERVRSVRHPYILNLERYEVIDGQLLVVMELADRNLWDRFKECRSQGLPGIPRPELLGYMEETAEALDLMNQEYQLQHLDIKPQNLFLIHNHVKVADFGLVKDLEGSQASVTGGITPVYAAPETFDGKVSRFSDQYSLAIVFQELLTGQRPFSGTNVRQLIMQHISAEPNVSALPAADQPLVRRALSKKPSERYPKCKELVVLLRRATTTAPATVPTLAPLHPSSHSGTSNITQGSWQGVVTPPPSSLPATASLRPTADSSQGTTQSLRALEHIALSPEPAVFRAPPDVSGPGCLFPALVIGLGQTGLNVVQKLREIVYRQVGPLTQQPHLRFLLLDTDPEVMRLATRGNTGASLTAGEIMLAQLNRPSYYLKPRDGKPVLDSWLNTRMLYRIPRSQVTTGVRSLGRLAFTDNHRAIVRRLQAELEAVLDPQALQTSTRMTGLGTRSNRPRVYVLAGLGGGTGSGMFLDVAYNVRVLLRQMGYENPDVVSLLLLPQVDGNRTRVMPVGNTYAALTELHYFGAPGRIFQARYHERDGMLQEQSPPFSRTILLPLPEETDEVANQEVMELCGQFLYRDLATPMGRACDLARAGLTAVPWEKRGQYCQTFNLFQLSWPRQHLLGSVARQLCVRVVQRWASKDAKPVREPARQHVQEEWVHQELGADSFIHRVQAEVVKALGRPAESLFTGILEPLSRSSNHGEGGSRSRILRGIDPAQIAQALEQMEKLLGRPNDDGPSDDPPQLIKLLRQGSDKLGAEWSQKLAEISVHLIEQPEFRLAGAEEAVRQLIATIEQVLHHHEPLAKDLAEKSANAYDHLRALAGLPLKQGQPRPRLSIPETLELLRAYPKWRYQSLVLQHLSAAFVGLRGHLSDELREVNFCRVRLAEMQRLFEEAAAAEQAPTSTSRKEGSIGRKLFLAGCKSLAEAVELYMQGITAEHLVELDGRMEEMLRGQYTALVHVCMTSANVVKDVQASMLDVARQFAEEYLPATSAAELFFEQFTDPQEAEAEVTNCYDEAAPEITPGRNPKGGVAVSELCVLSTPEDPTAGEQFRTLVAATLPETEVQQAVSPDDILFYRERVNVALIDLEQMGATAFDAYSQMTATDNFTPHSRSDLNFRER